MRFPAKFHLEVEVRCGFMSRLDIVAVNRTYTGSLHFAFATVFMVVSGGMVPLAFPVS